MPRDPICLFSSKAFFPPSSKPFCTAPTVKHYVKYALWLAEKDGGGKKPRSNFRASEASTMVALVLLTEAWRAYPSHEMAEEFDYVRGKKLISQGSVSVY